MSGVYEKCSGTISVSVLTPLFTFSGFDRKHPSILFSFANPSASRTITVRIQPSRFGVYHDADKLQTLTITPQSEASFEIGSAQMRKLWTVDAQTDDLSAVTMSYAVDVIEW